MSKLYFKFGAMASSKTANALMTRFNYEEKGNKVWLIKPDLDNRDDYTDENPENTSRLQNVLRNNISIPSATAYMVFLLLYLPCIATIVAIRSESRSWKWAAFSAVYSTILAYTLSLIAYLVCSTIISL